MERKKARPTERTLFYVDELSPSSLQEYAGAPEAL